MVRRLLEQLLIRPEDFPPSRPDFEVIGVFNPAAVLAGNEVRLLVRVVERPRERRSGFTPLPPEPPNFFEPKLESRHVYVDVNVGHGIIGVPEGARNAAFGFMVYEPS